MAENLIPPDILSYIFSLLPAVSILRCECVCKTWRSLILHNKHDPYFAKVHLHQQQQVLNDNHNFISTSIYREDDRKTRSTFLYDEYYIDDANYCYHKVRNLYFHPVEGIYVKIISSCNGLVCLEGICDDDTMLICNPLTREYVYLPTDNDYQNSKYGSTSGFGYHPGIDEYKVIRIYYQKQEPAAGRVQVYTIGKDNCGGWRDKAPLPHRLNCYSRGVLVSGVLYWLTELGSVIVSFDLADEVFGVVPLPPPLVYSSSIQKLEVLGGYLCIIKRVRDLKATQKLQIWIMKNKAEWTRSKELSIDSSISCVPCAFKTNGEVLMWHDRLWCLASYDPKNGSKLNVPAVDEHSAERYYRTCDKHNAERYCRTCPIPHTNSFVSLKALGEENANTIEAFTRLQTS